MGRYVFRSRSRRHTQKLRAEINSITLKPVVSNSINPFIPDDDDEAPWTADNTFITADDILNTVDQLEAVF